MAKEMSCRPSELMGIGNDYVAYCFDEAIYATAQMIRTDVESINHKKPKTQEMRRAQRLDKLLGIPVKFKSPTPS